MVEFVTITGPAAWASYLINGDASGLEPGERELVEVWLDREGVYPPVSCSDDAWFTRPMRLHCPELGCEAGDVLDYTCQPYGEA